MLPLDNFRRYITENTLFNPNERVLIALSGGRDSVLLAHLFNAAQYNFGIAHCNFMLRDEESAADERFSKHLAAYFNVPFYSIRFETLDYAEKHSISIQMAARDLRYEWLETTRLKNGYDFIAVAHHQNDSIETILLNLVRGTGIAGLHGIAPKRGNIIRPLLFLTRDDVDKIIQTEKIIFREDSSNLSSKYARNKLRIEVIPRLKELNPNLEATFEANRLRFIDLETILNQRVKEVRDMLFSTQSDNTIRLEIKNLEQLPALHTILYELLRPYHFKQPVVDDLIRSLKTQPGKQFESPTHLILIDRNELILMTRQQAELHTQEIGEDLKSVLWGDMHFTIKTCDAEKYRLIKDPNLAQLDADRLHFPLKLRTWRAGDRFKPFGFYGEKKLSDFFTGLKIPVTTKAIIPILENGNGEILCIPGIRIDDRYKITANTKKVFIFELIKPNGKYADFC